MNPRHKRNWRRPAIRSRPARTLAAHRAERLAALAAAHRAANEPEAAVEVRKGAVVLAADSVAARLELARALYHAGDFGQALAWLGRAGDAAAELLRGRILADLPDPAAAAAAFARAIAAAPQATEPRLRRAAVLLDQGDAEEALGDLDAVLARAPASRWARTLRASARLETGRAAAAIDDLMAIEPARRTVYHALLEVRARALAGEPDPAIDAVFAAAIERHPTDARLRLARARHLAARRAADPAAGLRAEQELEALQAADSSPRSLRAEACFALAELAAERPGGDERAEQLLHHGLGLAPDAARGLADLGALWLERGRPGWALQWLVRAALVEPERSQTAERLARALAAAGDDETAARWLGLLASGLPHRAPQLLARLLRHAREAGRAEAHAEVRRQAHRMKNRVAVLAAQARLDEAAAGWQQDIEALYEEWLRFLQSMHLPPPAPRPLAPAALVRRAVAQVAAQPQRLRLDLPADLPLVRGAEEQLVDALANVVDNALQASPPGRPVRVAARSGEPGRFVELAVTDEGPGVALADRQRIFEPGFTRKERGSGVGLAVTRRVVQAHGGRIELASAPGGPTTLRLALPVAPGGAAHLQPLRSSAIERLAAEESAADV